MTAQRHDAAVRVGVGVIIVRSGRVLIGARAGAHGAGTWALPGGHLEFGETVADCARREVREETGLTLHGIAPAPYASDVFAAEGRHYVTLFVTAQAIGEPELLEPVKCLGWQWCDWQALPQPLFPPLQTLYDSGFVPPGIG